MKKDKNSTKKTLLEAFDESETKTIADVCRRANVSRDTFYSYFNSDLNFRKQIIRKQKLNLSSKTGLPKTVAAV